MICLVVLWCTVGPRGSILLVGLSHSLSKMTVRWLCKNAESACSLCVYTHLLLLSLQIEAGQYCTFVISSDGSVRACGKGSYGRLGLGDSNNQSTLKKLTFEPHRAIKKVSSSKGSDGHTLAFTTEGEVFSWGDGDYGKLGHGNSSTQKYPKLIQGPLQGKVRFHPASEHNFTHGILMTWCTFHLFILSIQYWIRSSRE